MATTRKMIYLAGPIDALPDGGRGWRDHASALFGNKGLTCFDPSQAFRIAPKREWGPDGLNAVPCDTIRRVNRHALAHCHGVFAFLPDNARAFGTIREIEAAKIIAKPVVVVSDWLGDHIDSYDVEVFKEVDYTVAVNYLVTLC